MLYKHNRCLSSKGISSCTTEIQHPFNPGSLPSWAPGSHGFSYFDAKYPQMMSVSPNGTPINPYHIILVDIEGCWIWCCFVRSCKMVVSLNRVIPSERALPNPGWPWTLYCFSLWCWGGTQGLMYAKQGHQATPPGPLVLFLYLSAEILLNTGFPEIHSRQGSQEKYFNLYFQRNHITPMVKCNLHCDLAHCK